MNVDTTSVRDLKELLAPETNLPVHDQILVYNGRILAGGCGWGWSLFTVGVGS